MVGGSACQAHDGGTYKFAFGAWRMCGAGCFVCRCRLQPGLTVDAVVASAVRVLCGTQTGCSAPSRPSKKCTSTLRLRSLTVRHEAAIVVGQRAALTVPSLALADVFAGYNGCLLAYGQTGAGKTHTMTGPDAFDPAMRVRTQLWRVAQRCSCVVLVVTATWLPCDHRVSFRASSTASSSTPLTLMSGA